MTNKRHSFSHDNVMTSIRNELFFHQQNQLVGCQTYTYILSHLVNKYVTLNCSLTGYNIVNLNGVSTSAENEKTVMYYIYIREVHMAVTYGIFVSIDV